MPDAVYYAAHKEEHKASVKAYKIANRDKVREWNRNSARKMRAINPEKHREAVKDYAARNPEKVKARYARWLDSNPGYNQAYLMARAKTQPELYLFNHARRRAARLKIEFDLTPAAVVIPTHCPVLGIELTFGLGKRGENPSSPSIDRLVPEKGYTVDNVRVISMRANWLKSNGTAFEFAAIVDYMKREGCT